MVPGRLSPARAAVLLERARRAKPTYGPVGATLDAGAHDGELFVERQVGAGVRAFGAAVECFRSLAPQRAVATIWPPEASAEEGSTVLIALALGPVTVMAINRIVAVVDEPRRWGFAYGTLPGHAEVGEEAFVVEHRSDDTVVARVASVAHVAVPGARLLQPVLLPIQRIFANRYLDTVEETVAANGSSSGPPQPAR